MEKDQTSSYDITYNHGSLLSKVVFCMYEIEKELEILVDAVLRSEIYREYLRQKENVKSKPGLKEQVDDFRQRNYELQQSWENGFDKMDELEKQFEELLDNPDVSAFLDAEVAFCRMIQHINSRLVEDIKFE